MVPKSEKVDILTPPVVWHAPRTQKFKWRVLGFVALLASVLAVASSHHANLSSALLSAIRLGHHTRAELCPQSDILYPERHAQLWKNLGRSFDQDTFTIRAVEWLAGAVRIRYFHFIPFVLWRIF